MRLLIGCLMAATLAGCRIDLPVAPINQSRELVVALRKAPTTYQTEGEKPAGFEYDLLIEFARELGLPLRAVVAANDSEAIRLLRSGQVHIAAGWLSPLPGDKELVATRRYFRSQPVVVQHEAALAPTSSDDLSGKVIHVGSGSSLATLLHRLREKVPSLTVVERPDPDGLSLARDLADHKFEAMLLDAPVLDIAHNYFPELQATLPVGAARDIAWLMTATQAPLLLERANRFLSKLEADGTLAEIRDRYFGHIRRLTQINALEFITSLRADLPKYQQLFQQAQRRTNIDWRLIAALAYQESQWDPHATSFTGVRGMMMLTEETADRLNVSDRLDPKQSIPAGAEYLAILRNQLPDSVSEPDRTWLALAAYNLGMGHLNGARAIAKSLGADPDSWYAMKKVLPLLTRPEYYERLKSGRARGGEAVIMVENIRAFYDILSLHAPAYDPIAHDTENHGGRGIRPATMLAMPGWRQAQGGAPSIMHPKGLREHSPQEQIATAAAR